MSLIIVLVGYGNYTGPTERGGEDGYLGGDRGVAAAARGVDPGGAGEGPGAGGARGQGGVRGGRAGGRVAGGGAGGGRGGPWRGRLARSGMLSRPPRSGRPGCPWGWRFGGG